jgi:hypothetical protein
VGIYGKMMLGSFMCNSKKVAKSSFQGSLYLSRESLGNHFFEEFQKSMSIYICRHGEFQGGPISFYAPLFDFEALGLLDAPAG